MHLQAPERPLHRTSLPIPGAALSCFALLLGCPLFLSAPGPTQLGSSQADWPDFIDLFKSVFPGGAERGDPIIWICLVEAVNSKAIEEPSLPRKRVSRPPRNLPLGHF